MSKNKIKWPARTSGIYNINAYHSTVIVGNSGSVHIGADYSDMEAELLKVFRALPMRDRVKIMNSMYELLEEQE